MKHKVWRKLVVRAKTVSLSARHIEYFTVHFCILFKINDDDDDDDYYTLTDVINVFLRS